MKPSTSQLDAPATAPRTRAIEVEPVQTREDAHGACSPYQFTPLEPSVLEPLCSVFRRKLRSEGLKYTPERAQVLETVSRLGLAQSSASNPPVHFAADAVLADVRRAGFDVSKATMYRTLKLLLDAGIIRRVLGQGDQACFAFAYGSTHPTPSAVTAHPHVQVEVLDARVDSTSSLLPDATLQREVEAACAQVCARRGLALVRVQLTLRPS